MDFSWNATDEELYQRILTFSLGLTSERDPTRDPRRFPVGQWKECARFGLMGLCIPERYGGIQLGALSTARAMEAFGRGCVDMGFVFSVAAHLFACAVPILEYGNDRLKERVLTKLCDGSWIAGNAITEAGAGSDAFALECRAERRGNEYWLTGTKTYVTNGPIADVMVVYASTAPEHGHLGISAFVVESDRPGLRAGAPFDKIGLETAQTSAVYLEECRVPADNMLGEPGSGARVFTTSMGWERACLFAAYVGVMDRQLEQVIEYARERRQYRKRLGNFQAIAHKIANMKIRLESARLLLYRACWLMDQDRDAALEISMAKVAVSEAAVQCALDAIQIHGGVGVAKEASIEHTLRDAIPATIFSGTSEIQRNLIARALGL